MFVGLYANGAPEEIRTPDPQIRSLLFCAAADSRPCSLGFVASERRDVYFFFPIRRCGAKRAPLLH
jgi:hypothetical protein